MTKPRAGQIYQDRRGDYHMITMVKADKLRVELRWTGGTLLARTLAVQFTGWRI